MSKFFSWLSSTAYFTSTFYAFNLLSQSRTTHCFNPLHNFPVRSLLTQASMSSNNIPQDENGWRTILSPGQFRVLRQKGTEPPGFSEKTKGELEYELKHNYGTKYPKEGAYLCVGCQSPLYYAKTKFDSGCGWPAFYQGIPGAIRESADADGHRIEILCNNCGSHLGHVFKGEGFPTPSDER